MELTFKINLLKDGSVVTKDGEVLGTWDTDESDAFYQFTPEGAGAPIFLHPFMGELCTMIVEWHAKQSN
ncbi:hypothetical protein PSE_4181 [Pseudovibrio sp. FO-BEG1]|uniref:hypothetical protein n=1 Tax=Pseudovibrio sp. (strain FO-BEG1) TaxID=911045 RepID=UPI000238D213|nr:hypothetical protein [Pseudovibrio sp. FO-BEG1]AEV38685.1 hypothetical protein PSE_4181 [Pseudovibrio sp. FO-BEG1]